MRPSLGVCAILADRVVRGRRGEGEARRRCVPGCTLRRSNDAIRRWIARSLGRVLSATADRTRRRPRSMLHRLLGVPRHRHCRPGGRSRRVGVEFSGNGSRRLFGTAAPEGRLIVVPANGGVLRIEPCPIPLAGKNPALRAVRPVEIDLLGRPRDAHEPLFGPRSGNDSLPPPGSRPLTKPRPSLPSTPAPQSAAAPAPIRLRAKS